MKTALVTLSLILYFGVDASAALRSAWMTRDVPQNAGAMPLADHFDEVLEILGVAEEGSVRGVQIARLREYRDRGRFPVNLVSDQPVPVFIDPDGTHCAVGYLMKRSGWGAEACEISRMDNGIYLDGEVGAVVEAWIAQSGLTKEEAALIQPAYWPELPRLSFAQAVELPSLAIGLGISDFSHSFPGDPERKEIVSFPEGDWRRPRGTALDGEILLLGKGEFPFSRDAVDLPLYQGGNGESTVSFTLDRLGYRFSELVIEARRMDFIIPAGKSVTLTVETFDTSGARLRKASLTSGDGETLEGRLVLPFEPQDTVNVVATLTVEGEGIGEVTANALLFGISRTAFVARLDIEIELTGERRGNVTVRSREGTTYFFRRWNSENPGVMLNSGVAGTGDDLAFPFDDSASDRRSGFFQVFGLPSSFVEEVREVQNSGVMIQGLEDLFR